MYAFFVLRSISVFFAGVVNQNREAMITYIVHVLLNGNVLSTCIKLLSVYVIMTQSAFSLFYYLLLKGKMCPAGGAYQLNPYC